MKLDKNAYGLDDEAPDTIEELIRKRRERWSIRSDMDASTLNILSDAFEKQKERISKLEGLLGEASMLVEMVIMMDREPAEGSLGRRIRDALAEALPEEANVRESVRCN